MANFGPLDDGGAISFADLYAILPEWISEIPFDFIQSSNYDGPTSPTTGFKIGIDGSSFFGSGVTIGADLKSSNWDGASDDLSGGAVVATAGYLLDYSAGAAQFQSMYAEGGELGGLTVSGDLTVEANIILGTNGVFQSDADGNNRWEIQNGSSNSLLLYGSDNNSYFKLSTNGTDIVFDTVIGTSATSKQDMRFYSDTFVKWLLGAAPGTEYMNLTSTELKVSTDLDLDGDLKFLTQNDGIVSADGTDILQVNNDGIAYENAATVFPNRVSVSPTDVTTFAGTGWITTPTSTITLWTHGGANRVVEVMAWAQGVWSEAGAVAYTGEIKIQVSVNGGSTWVDGVASGPVYVGTGTGAQGYRGFLSAQFHSEFASATGDIQVRMQHKVGNTGMDALRRMHLMAVVEQIF